MKSLFLALALASSALAHADVAHSPMSYRDVVATPTDVREAEIAALFDRWNLALASGDADQVTGLYADNGVLEPTVSNEVRATPADIKAYFVKFLKLSPRGTINYRQIRMLGADAALDTGVYTFNLKKDGKAQELHARYTYVYKKVGNDWKILNHHSSLMPE